MNGYQPMTLLRFWLSMLLGLWLSSPTAADPPPTSPAPTIALPAQTEPTSTTLDSMPSPYGAILISVKLDGHKPATFQIDSGVSVSTITDILAKQLGLTPQPALLSNGKPRILAGQPEQVVKTSLKIGDYTVTQVPLVIVNEDGLHLPAIVGQPIDGVIGANLLRILPCFIDFQNHKVTFFRHSPVTAQQRNRLGMQDAIACPLIALPDAVIYLTSVHLVHDKYTDDENLMVDTGGQGTLLSEETAQKLHLGEIPQAAYHTSFGEIAIARGVLSSLSLLDAHITLKDQNVIYAKEDLPKGYMAGLGRDTLSQYQVLLDFGAKTMYLKSLAAPVPAVATPLLSDVKDPPVVEVSFEGKSLAGKTTGTFLLNPLQTLSSFSPEMADKLGLTPVPAFNSDGTPLLEDGTNTPMQTTVVSETHLGGQTILNAFFLIVPTNNFTSGNHPIDGVLGQDVLEDHSCLLDMAKKQITFWGSDAFTPADLKSVDMADAAVVPVSLDGTVPAILSNGKMSETESLVMDTTFPSNLIAEVDVTKLSLSPNGQPVVIPSPDGTFTFQHTSVPEVKLGSLILKDFYTGYFVGSVPPGETHHLGIPFFSQNRVLFDFAHKVMYVKPNPANPMLGSPS